MFASRTAWKLTPNRLAIALEQQRAAGKKIVDLTASNPTSVGLQHDHHAIANSLVRPEILQYIPQPKGLPHARQAVADYYLSRGDPAPDSESIVLTTSTSEGYSFIFRLLCEAGDEVLTPAPSYPLFDYLAAVNDVRTAPYHLFYDHGWHIDLHSVDAAITPRTRAIIVVHPNNPTGCFVSRSAWQHLNELCSKHQLALIADEVFLDYQLTGAARRSFVGNTAALTFVLSGISKICALPQMKLAWIVAAGPEELAAEAMARLEVIADTYLSVSAPVQIAAPVWLEQRSSIQKQLCLRICTNLRELDIQIARLNTCARLEIEGGWYAVLRVPVTGSDEDLALRLLEKRSVLVHPGHFFDFPQEGYLVLSLIAPPDEFATGVRRMADELSC